MKNLAILLMASIAISVNVRADIEKIAMPSNSGFQFYWWPKVTPPPGWHQDKEQSLANAVNTLAPDGSTFGDAEAVMYAKAIFKPREPDVKSLDMLIERDKKESSILSSRSARARSPVSSRHQSRMSNWSIGTGKSPDRSSRLGPEHIASNQENKVWPRS